MEFNKVERDLLQAVADLHSIPQGAVNIRRDGEAVLRRSSPNIEIVGKTDRPGIDIIVKPGTVNESVHIPVILTRSGFKDVVYNTFIIGEGSDVLVVAGCGIHNAGQDVSRHDGIHEVIVKKGARMRYVEKHYGEGRPEAQRILNPNTVITVEEGAQAEMELVQIRGVDHTRRVTTAYIYDRGSLKIVEKLLTHRDQEAESTIEIHLVGTGGVAQVISRSVAQESSRQEFRAALIGKARSNGHVECDAIIMDRAQIRSVPELVAENAEAVLTHEAAIGRIAGEQLIKLMSLGLTEQEAVDAILSGFLR
ncbi:SufB/SufD family protein [Syntrophothermus lipocalidus]|uniref:SufBD protein n=1 Tax=Syntrophothermus lipocalidus (strain DSM 12680 / TGB-C1) TaxID=643648 RepID=D7CNN2_SYNLT|nr:SufD family Fe-S cluster assembly protein [Syntrophothermus lipocalidus]ADI02317.1 SufBD protein [Syntrophothermus lipocalidus DSM 12680]